MKIAIFTPYTLNPLHPRTEMIRDKLKKNGHEVDIHNYFSVEKAKKYFLNKLTLGFFDLSFMGLVKEKMAPYDLIFVQDLLFIPLVVKAKKLHKKVIFETLDNNVHLHYYHMVKKYPVLRFFGFIRNFYAFIERYLTSKYADATIVNSKALVEHFRGKANLLYYASPFEDMAIKNNPANKKLATIYLGWFCKYKGAEIIIDFVKKRNVLCYIFGSIDEQDILDEVMYNRNFVFVNRLSSSELRDSLEKIMTDTFLFGFSVTQDVNKSNATQEINKDIDYLSIGIPIIGNHRIPTEEKINAGCGAFLEDEEKISKLFDNEQLRVETFNNCVEYYRNIYSSSIFEERLMQIVKQLQNK
jgi:glycosyltransferase involved in cell wall biosynthesis